jgi:hypothetical protein
MDAPSKGSFLNREIKNVYPYTKRRVYRSDEPGQHRLSKPLTPKEAKEDILLIVSLVAPSKTKCGS